MELFRGSWTRFVHLSITYGSLNTVTVLRKNKKFDLFFFFLLLFSYIHTYAHVHLNKRKLVTICVFFTIILFRIVLLFMKPGAKNIRSISPGVAWWISMGRGEGCGGDKYLPTISNDGHNYHILDLLRNLTQF